MQELVKIQLNQQTISCQVLVLKIRFGAVSYSLSCKMESLENLNIDMKIN